MRPIIIDTNAYSAFKKGDSNITSLMQLAEKIIISPIVLGELLAGFAGGSRFKQNKHELDQFLFSERVSIYPVTADTSLFFSKIITTLRKKGSPIPTNDIWIAAQALEHGYQVCTFDKHFNSIEGLVVINSPSDLI